MRHRITIALATPATLVAALAIPTAASANIIVTPIKPIMSEGPVLVGSIRGSINARELSRIHHCKPMSAHVQAPITGYMIGQHSYPRAPLFYRGSDSLTAGLFFGDGGDWVLVKQCTR